MFIFLFILFVALFLCFMLYLINSAPYRYYKSEGTRFFKNLDEMKNYPSNVKSSPYHRDFPA